jgi:NADP-dependent 3-hydroxy acid dehydrogenase YdfG
MIDAVSKEILASVDHIDILINNAGRSIRRAVHESLIVSMTLNVPCNSTTLAQYV